MAAYTRETAERDAAAMQGWDGVHVHLAPEPAIDGTDIYYISARDPISGRTAIWDADDQPQARWA